MPHPDDESDNDDDWEDDYGDDDLDDGYVPCPHCGETMLEAADHCPSCDRWITSEGVPNNRHSWWIVALILILIATMVISIMPK